MQSSSRTEPCRWKDGRPISSSGSDLVWVCTLSTPAIKLLDDTGAPEVSDVINTSGKFNVDNSSVVSVNVSDDQLIKDVVIEYRVNGGSWLKSDSDTYYHNGAFALSAYPTDRDFLRHRFH